MNIALYARVSSETQAREGTIESQIEALREYAKVNQLTIVEECLDDGYSGTTLDRPALDRVRDLALAGSIDGVLILAPDRLSRKQANQIILMEEFKKRNVQLIFSNQTYNDTPEDNLMIQIQGAIAEYEREKILDRMRRGIVHSVKKGQIIGSKPPYGYRFIPKTKDTLATWEVNPDEAKIVQLVFNWYVREGIKGTQIADRLNDEAISSRSTKWWSSQIYNMLKNEVYTGTAYMFKYKSMEPKKNPKHTNTYRKTKKTVRKLRPREEWIGVPVTPIIDKATWNNAQEILKLNAYKSRRNNNKNQYLLRGLVLCGLCGCMAPGYVSNKHTYYSCGAKRNRNITTKFHDELIQVSHKPFDEKVWLGLQELLGDPESLKRQLEKRLEIRRSKLPFNNSTRELDRELVQLDAQEKRILDAYREEVIGLDDLKEQKGKIAKRRKVIEGKKNTALAQQKSLGQSEITMDKLGDVSTRFQRVMTKASFEKQERLVNLLVNSVNLFPNKAIVKGSIPISNLDVLNPNIQRCRFWIFIRRDNPVIFCGWSDAATGSMPELRSGARAHA